MSQTQRIFLVGYMGAGKTTIGNRLAQCLELNFIDLDSFIENRCHKTIEQIISEKGEFGFREIEQSLLQEVSQFENVIISTGGGTPCFFDNMSLMNRAGITIYLKVSSEVLIRRLNTRKDKRPLIKKLNGKELEEFVTTTINQRKIFYNQATYICETEQWSTDNNVDSIVGHLISKINKQG